MDSDGVLRICRKDPVLRNIFVGVFPCNKIPKVEKLPFCLIANTKPHNHPGEHWVAIFVNKEGYGDFFCSYGLKPDKVFVDFMGKHCVDWNYSQKCLQNIMSTTCGQYAVFFLHARANGLPLKKFMELFTKNQKENDTIVTTFINGLYDENTQICNFEIFNQSG